MIGGSRVRGDNLPGSDLDVGFGHLNANQADKHVKSLEGKFGGKDGFLSLEKTRIVPGSKTANIEEIKSPEEFFQRSGTRSGLDPKAGQEYKASGSITLEKDGTITLLTPGTAP